MNEISVLTDVPARTLAELPILSLSPEKNKLEREAALAFFRDKGFPEKDHEDYKYSPSSKIFSEFLAASVGVSPAADDLPKGIVVRFDGTKLLIEGRDLLSEGLVICSLQEALIQEHPAALKYLNTLFEPQTDPLLALNIAGAVSGLFIFVPKNLVFKPLIQVVYPEAKEEKGLLHLKSLYVVSEQAECVISEYWFSTDERNRGITYSTELVVEGNGRANLYKNQMGASGAVLFDHTHALLLGKGVLKTITVSHGGKWIRNNLNIEMRSAGAEVHLNGLFFAAGKQHVDNHTAVVHAMPHCESHQLYKGILNQNASGVFNGKILVKRDAQKTNAYQSSKNLILGNQASVNAKPQLEIFADDVKCSHGSSTGKIDQDALFYLRCRGISENSARRLLLDAFASEVLDTIEHEEISAFAGRRIFSEGL